MKPRNLLCLGLLVPVLLTGCRFGEERTEVRGNGQGGVDVKYVPNVKPAEPAPQAAPQNATANDQSRMQQQQQQIEQLQSQLKQQDEEIRRLKGLPATQPANQP